jgi:hypothetical protein
MMLAATEAAQNTTLYVILGILCVGAMVSKKPFAVVAIVVGAAAGKEWIAPHVKTEGNFINTDASPMTGGVLAGVFFALILYAFIAKKLA